MMHHSSFAFALLLLGTAVPSNALLRGSGVRGRSSNDSRSLKSGGGMSMGGGGMDDGFRTDDFDCDDLKTHPLDTLAMFGIEDPYKYADAFDDCDPGNIRSDGACITLEEAEATYKEPALQPGAMGIHCTDSPACRQNGESPESWACLVHSKEWFCGDPRLWTGTIPMCEPGDDINIADTAVGTP